MDIARLDLNLLTTLEALLDERSVSRAARRLQLSQPALSAQLGRLRTMFGDQLFVPSHRGMTPTPLSLQLEVPLRAALARLREVVTTARAFDPAHDEFIVRIAASDYVQTAVLLDFLVALRLQAPGLRVALRAIDPLRLAAQLEQGEVDFAMLTPENISETLRSRPLFEERYRFAARKGHPALRGKLDLRRYGELEHVICSPVGGGFSTSVDELLALQGIERRVAVSASTFHAAMDLVERSDLVALVPSYLLRQRTGLRSCDPPMAIPGFTIHLAWHDRTHRDVAQSWVREQLTSFIAGLSTGDHET
jgi:DNA-binding transcriptional LysR family regulator